MHRVYSTGKKHTISTLIDQTRIYYYNKLSSHRVSCTRTYTNGKVI